MTPVEYLSLATGLIDSLGLRPALTAFVIISLAMFAFRALFRGGRD